MNWFYMKLQPKDEDDVLFVHYGLPRTGSSTIRFLIRRYCNLLGLKWESFEAQNAVVNPGCKYLLVEIPYPVHLATNRECRYITTLRDPVKAVCSWYFWLTRIGRKITLEDYVRQLPKSYNLMSRWLIRLNDETVSEMNRAQPDFMNDTTGFFNDIPDDELYKAALEAIESKISLIGILEQFEDFSFAMLDLFAWKILPVYSRTNYSIKPRDWSFNRLEKSMKKKIMSSSAVDRRVFSYVRKRFRDVSADVRNKYGNEIEKYRSFCRQLDDFIVREKGLVLEDGNIVSQNWEQTVVEKPIGIEIKASIQKQLGIIMAEDWLPII